MSLTQDHDDVPELAPGAADVLQAATRMLAGWRCGAWTRWMTR